MKIGQAVKLTFHDHAKYSGDNGGPIVCTLFGELVAITPLSYEVASWYNSDDKTDENNECFSVLKSTVIDARELFEDRGKKK